eukprot:6203197-Pleurochrysis_carterae.AAC.2
MPSSTAVCQVAPRLISAPGIICILDRPRLHVATSVYGSEGRVTKTNCSVLTLASLLCAAALIDGYVTNTRTCTRTQVKCQGWPFGCMAHAHGTVMSVSPSFYLLPQQAN